ncbi:MAG TPA: ketoacyl-ACP synthase III [Syntrophales bacterium]|nr:ketoacyl-ACP synthase III [Syntrophales bacterium]
MRDVGIQDIKSYIPKSKLTNADLVKRLDVDEAFLRDKVGISSRAIADGGEAASDLALHAAERILSANPALERKDVDLLIVVTQNPDFKLPHTSAILQHKLGLGPIAAFDVNLGCSGFVYSLAIAKSMMNTLGFKNTVLITVDPYSKIIAPDDKDTVTIFGDAATATWLNHQSSNRLLGFTFGSDGADYESLIVKGGGSRFPLQPGETGRPSSSENCNLYMDGRRIFNFMLKKVPRDVLRCLQINQLHLADIDHFIFHQASKFMIENLARKMKIPMEKVVIFLEDIGNTVSSSIPIALENLMNSVDLSGKKVLISGFGVGLSWSSTVINFDG